jgi:hypothetical protein
MSFRLAVAFGAVVALGGCNTVNQNIGSDDPAFGEAMRYNAAIQIIDPDPVYAPGGALPGDNGAKGAAAMKRYRTDAVKQVETMQTSSGSGSPR